MKVMIDTNIIISAMLSPQGKAAKAFYKAIQLPFEPLVCPYIIDEVQRKFAEKLAAHASKLHNFNDILPLFYIVPTPIDNADGEMLLRDVKDMPILRAAIAAKADYLLTGDKDFLEAAIENPKIVSVAQFLEI